MIESSAGDMTPERRLEFSDSSKRGRVSKRKGGKQKSGFYKLKAQASQEESLSESESGEDDEKEKMILDDSN